MRNTNHHHDIKGEIIHDKIQCCTQKIIKTPKLPTEEMKRKVVQKLVSDDVLRTSKYHKKIQSNIRKTIN